MVSSLLTFLPFNGIGSITQIDAKCVKFLLLHECHRIILIFNCELATAMASDENLRKDVAHLVSDNISAPNDIIREHRHLPIYALSSRATFAPNNNNNHFRKIYIYLSSFGN